VYDDEHRRTAVRRDRELLDRTAAWLRAEAIYTAYAGLHHQHVAFGLALILDELARHVVELDDAVRQQAVQACRQLLGRGS
jgi:hypothetical protein